MLCSVRASIRKSKFACKTLVPTLTSVPSNEKPPSMTRARDNPWFWLHRFDPTDSGGNWHDSPRTHFVHSSTPSWLAPPHPGATGGPASAGGHDRTVDGGAGRAPSRWPLARCPSGRACHHADAPARADCCSVHRVVHGNVRERSFAACLGVSGGDGDTGQRPCGGRISSAARGPRCV